MFWWDCWCMFVASSMLSLPMADSFHFLIVRHSFQTKSFVDNRNRRRFFHFFFVCVSEKILTVLCALNWGFCVQVDCFVCAMMLNNYAFDLYSFKGSRGIKNLFSTWFECHFKSSTGKITRLYRHCVLYCDSICLDILFFSTAADADASWVLKLNIVTMETTFHGNVRHKTLSGSPLYDVELPNAASLKPIGWTKKRTPWSTLKLHSQ